MNITKSILDRKISEFEKENESNLTFREWIRDRENYYELESLDLDSMTDIELDDYDTWLWELDGK